jgi:hypothetical protein
VCDTVDLLKTFHLTLQEAVQDRSIRLRIGLCLTYITKGKETRQLLCSWSGISVGRVVLDISLPWASVRRNREVKNGL